MGRRLEAALERSVRVVMRDPSEAEARGLAPFLPRLALPARARRESGGGGGGQGFGGLARLAALLSLSVGAWACRRTSLTFTRNAVAFEGLWCSTASAISLAPARREHQGD